MGTAVSARRRAKVWGGILILLLVAVVVVNIVMAIAMGGESRDSQLEYGYVSNNLALVRGDFGGKTISSDDDVLKQIVSVKKYGFNSVKDELILTRKTPAAVGTLYRYQQLYKGLEVFGRQLIATVGSGGKITSVSGNYLPNIDLDISSARAPTSSSGRLVVYSVDTPPVLAYEYYEGAYRVFDNAVTGERIVNIPLSPGATATTERVEVELTDHNGTKHTLPIEKVVGEGKYILGDATRNIYIYDAKGTATGESFEIKGDQYTSTDGSFVDAEAIAAYNALIRSYDFYATEANTGIAGGMLGVDGGNDRTHGNAESNDEVIVKLFMHYDKQYNNAFYRPPTNLSERLVQFGIGDGDDIIFTNLAKAADVIGHEYSHAVAEYATRLVYLNASGAISEAIADIFGALIEGKGMQNEGFWQIGEDVMASRDELRNMRDPSKNELPHFVNNAYDKEFCYEPHNHYASSCDNGGVHTNSTIISHIMYRLYSADNAFFDEVQQSKLWYNALQKLNPTATYEDVRLAMEQTALELGYTTVNQAIISKAFKDAGIIATVGNVTMTFLDYAGATVHTISGRGGDTFVVPTGLSGADVGYTTVHWREAKYSAIYEIGKSYTLPYYDTLLRSVNTLDPWNNITPTTLSGEGTLFDPYLIGSAEDLASLSYYSNAKHPVHSTSNQYWSMSYYRQTADIDLLNIPWLPIGNSEKNGFAARYDGGGYSISNLKIDAVKNVGYYGLFGVTSNSAIINNVNISSGNVAVATAVHTGGIVGLNKGSITACTNNANIVGNTEIGTTAGGIAGNNWAGKISDCSNYGEVSGYNAGGIFGNNICTGIESEVNNINKGKIIPLPVVMGNNINTGKIVGVNAGGIAGVGANTYLVNCINIGEIAASATIVGVKSVGGIVGMLNVKTTPIYHPTFTAEENAGILGCKNTGVIDTTADNHGGIAGIFSSPLTTGNTLSEKNVYKSQDGLTAFGDSITFDGVRIIGAMPSESTDGLYSGDFDFDNVAFMHDFDVWTVFSGTSIFDTNMGYQLALGEMPVYKTPDLWIDHYATAFNGGDGTQDDPYQISTPQQLARLAYLSITDSAYSGKHYIVTTDIDLAGKKWVSIGGQTNHMFIGDTYYSVVGRESFGGVFDGGGHTISNMSVGSENLDLINDRYGTTTYEHSYLTSQAGLFGSIGNGNGQAEVKNINLVAVNAVGQSLAGGVVANMRGGNIINCHVNGGAVTSINEAGGIVGEIDYYFSEGVILIDRANVNVSVSAAMAGGIVGGTKGSRSNAPGRKIYAKIYNSINHGKVTAFSRIKYFEGASVGGIIGRVEADVTIRNCINAGEIVSYNNWGNVGGAIGLATTESYYSSTGKVNVVVEGFKNLGSVAAYGQVNYIDGVLGRGTHTPQSTLSIKIAKSVIVGDKIFGQADASGDGVFGLEIGGNFTGAVVGGEHLKLGDIEYYFNSAYWTNIDPDFANDMYEFNGGERIENAVTFLDYLGNTLATVNVRYMCSAVPPMTTEKPSTVGTVYTHSGWNLSLKGITVPTTFSPTYTSKVRQYTVTFLDYDGSVYHTVYYTYGSMVMGLNYNPSKPDMTASRYEFSGWDRDFELVIGDATYTPQFSEKPMKYQAKFLSGNGNVLSSSLFDYGCVPRYEGSTPTKDSTVPHDYVFSGWDKEFSPITENTVYTPIFKESVRKYKVVLRDGGDNFTSIMVDYGSVPNLDGITSFKPLDSNYVYIFEGWEGDLSPILGANRSFVAKFRAEVRLYTVKFYDYYNKLLQEEALPYGSQVTPPENPSATIIVDGKKYYFVGWSKTVNGVQDDYKITAEYALKTDQMIVSDIVGISVGTVAGAIVVIALIAVGVRRIKRKAKGGI